MAKPLLEVADVFRAHGESYRQHHAASLCAEQLRVMRAIKVCRTAALGGHVDQCDQCGHQVISYNSCRNRHCPKCQNLDKALWREARRAEVLPVDYYHVVFTLPQQLNAVALQNKKAVYGLLFHAASQALLRIGADSRHLGGELGFLAVLHTWGQNLMLHPHLHCLVPGGALAKDPERWIPCKKRFFLPVRVLSRLFRRLFLEGLEQLFLKGRLQFHGELQALATPPAFGKLLCQCRKRDWVVYAKPPCAGAETVVDYLARYTHRIAISNHRLLAMDNGNVSFSYKDYKTGGAQKTMTLEAQEFIRRFLLHVLPSGFQRIRYYGFLANRQRAQKLARCRKLLQAAPPTPPITAAAGNRLVLLQLLTGLDPTRCPHCHQGNLLPFATLPAIPHASRKSTPPGRAP